jgi:formyltetrahydrofolate hydrolase
MFVVDFKKVKVTAQEKEKALDTLSNGFKMYQTVMAEQPSLAVLARYIKVEATTRKRLYVLGRLSSMFHTKLIKENQAAIRKLMA